MIDIQPYALDVLRVAPELRGAPMTPMGEGMDNRAFLVGDGFVYRFAKHAEASDRLEREVALLPRLAARVNLPIPHIEYLGHQPSHGLGFVGHRLIRGVPLPAGLTGRARERAVRDLAEFLAALLAVPVEEARAWGVVDDDPRPGYAEDLDRARTEIYPLVEPSVRASIERLFETYFADESLLDYEPALLHADLAADHIRFSVEEQRITGIIDWGDASIGDPDYELSYLWQAGGARFVEELIRHGPPRDLAKLTRKLQFFAGHDTIGTLLTALERGEVPLIECSLKRLRQEAGGGPQL